MGRCDDDDIGLCLFFFWHVPTLFTFRKMLCMVRSVHSLTCWGSNYCFFYSSSSAAKVFLFFKRLLTYKYKRNTKEHKSGTYNHFSTKIRNISKCFQEPKYTSFAMLFCAHSSFHVRESGVEFDVKTECMSCCQGRI